MRRLLAATALAVMFAGQAFAEVETIPFWSRGGWNVSAVPERNKCIAQAMYTLPGGATLSMGFEAFINNSAAILVNSKSWKRTFHKDKKYLVNVAIDGAKPQRLMALAYGDGALAFDNLTFDAIKAFALGRQIRFSYKGDILASLNLPGSYGAVDNTVSCVRTMQAAIAKAGRGGNVDDGTGPVEEETPAMQAQPQQQKQKPQPTVPASEQPAPKEYEL